MKLFYRIVEYAIENKFKDEMAPLLGISLYDFERFPASNQYYDVGKNKEFSLMTQDIGLSWSEKYRCYVIPDDVCFDKKMNAFMKKIDIAISKINSGLGVSELIMTRERKQAYYTESNTAKVLHSFINLSSVDNPVILDPCAGVGNLVDGLNVDRDLLWLIEPDSNCCQKLRNKGYKNIVNSTFELAIHNQLVPQPTHIIMNPPFSKRRDITFFNMACDFLCDGGTIAAIFSENSIFEELNRFNLDFGLTIDEIASMFYKDERISMKLRTFFENILDIEPGFVEPLLTGYKKFGFTGTCARTYYTGGKIRRRVNK